MVRQTDGWTEIISALYSYSREDNFADNVFSVCYFSILTHGSYVAIGQNTYQYSSLFIFETRYSNSKNYGTSYSF